MTDREQFLHDYNVPRGTAPLFDRYAELLTDWQGRMNLVARSTLEQVWLRHLADSAQLIELAPNRAVQWLDMGAGAGFPGIVVAVLTDHAVTLVEATGKKCRFLEAVVDALGLRNVTICNGRVEAFRSGGFDVISARAFAPLTKLFELGRPHARADTKWLLPKGRTVEQELIQARQVFEFKTELVPSRTDPQGHIVVARQLRRKAGSR